MFQTWEIVLAVAGAILVAWLSTRSLRVVRDRRHLAMESAITKLLVGATAEVTRIVTNQLATFPSLLNEKMQQQLIQFERERELREWIRVDVILHGLSWSNAAHALVLLNVRTQELRPAPEGQRFVQGEGYPFSGIPRAVFGSPRWKLVSDAPGDGQIAMLGVIYTWH